ncbi:selenide, water dikinase SelD [Helicobacter sp. faydin-H20]|uniref:selenide, water dikinase SelD n=1 Tax=Helicobacter anatolicus TaxID=2905874 RepID=UPI001E57A92D|nr:selenide, water dikinase SelD [Helicobacter anatolicus]
MFSSLNQPQNPNLIVGFEHNEDCGIYQISSSNFLLQSVDFITPVVDDPYIYGKIAAANALSDIFTMGSEVQTALNILMWDREHVSKEALGEILKGGMEKIIESNAVLLGGHTIIDREQKYGLSVSGITQKFWKNNTAKIGDVLILCKPIGSGIITTALKKEKLLLSQAQICIDSMQLLNLYAMRVAKKYPISACTDITGFGLIGHIYEMCREDLGINLFVDSVAIFPQVMELISQGCVSGGSKNNKAYYEKYVKKEKEMQEDIFLYDAQTSGGIVFALSKEKANFLLDELKKTKYEYASIIGEFVPRRGDCAIVLG